MAALPIRVLVADDQEVVREGWKRILEGAENISVVGEAITAQEAPHRVKEKEADVVLMDLKWFGDENAAFASIREIKKDNPGVIVIGVTVYESLIREARAAGADTVVIKDISRPELISLLREMSHKKQAPPESIPYAEKLTSREAEVLQLVADGFPDKQIAVTLGISLATAKHHVKNIIAKLDVTNRTQAARAGRERGWIR
jgi:DNA-binding NarL/FixJ family response regulator